MIEERFLRHNRGMAQTMIQKIYGVDIPDERWEKEAEIIMAKVLIDVYWRIYFYKDTEAFKKIHGFDLMQKFLSKEVTNNNDIVTGYDGG